MVLRLLRGSCLLLLGGLIWWPLSASQAGNWPRFRGPNGTGLAEDEDIPSQWNEQTGILWKVALPGMGNSSPIVWGERVLVQSAGPEGKDRQLLCFHTRTGKLLWSRQVPGTPARTHPKNTLASSTPATDGQRVYAAFWDGRNILLTAFDLDGQLLWQRDLGPFVSQHGAGASPIVFGDKVFFVNDQDGTSCVLALDKTDGRVLWQAPRPAFRACYSAPLIRQEAGADPELLVVSTMEITGYDLASGRKNWSWTWKFSAKMPLRTTGSPLLLPGLLVACSGDGGGDRHMVALALEGQGSSTRPRLLWENKRDFPYVPTVLGRGEYLYFVNDRGLAGCYAARTGKRIWYERLSADGFLSSPILVGERIYAVSESGEVFVLAAAPTFRLLARNSVGDPPVRATPAVGDGRLFLRTAQHLVCIGHTRP
jgi:outer membrane protein assembly factor BamB